MEIKEDKFLDIDGKEMPIKRPIFKIGNENPVAIDLSHIDCIKIEENNLVIYYHGSSLSLNINDKEKAIELFDKLVKLWATNVVE